MRHDGLSQPLLKDARSPSPPPGERPGPLPATALPPAAEGSSSMMGRGLVDGYLYPEDAMAGATNQRSGLRRPRDPSVRRFIKKQGLPLATSMRSVFIYGQFLVVPFLVALFWVLLPDRDYYSWAVSSGLYFFYSFNIWQAWFDVLLPGCSQLLCQIFNVLFIAGVVGWYAVMKITEIEHQKLAYTLVALYGLFLNLTCFAIHVWQSRVFRQAPKWEPAPLPEVYYSDDRSAARVDLEGLQNYTESLKEEADKKRGPTFQDQQKIYTEKDLHCSRWFYNIFCFIEWIDWNRKQESSAAHVEIAWKTLVWGFIYRALLFGVWAWLQFFTEFVVQLDVFKNSFVGIFVLCLYQVVRVIILKVMFAINDRLPGVKELKYFSQFAVPLLLYLYYRNLFLSVNQWWMVIVMSIVVFITQFVIYPVQMSQYVYDLRFGTLKRKLQKSGKPWLNALAEGIAPSNVNYETYLTTLTVEYYFDEIATYMSLGTTFVFFPIIRYTYNNSVYPLIRDLSEDEFQALMLRFLFLFAAEAGGDMFIKIIIYFVYRINAASTGRNLTVLNYRTRFLFGIFVVWLVTSTYYSMVRLDKIIS
jgi:hypothetical protein